MKERIPLENIITHLSFSPLPLASLLFSAIFKASLDNHFVFLHLFFLRMVLIPASCTMSWTSVRSSSGTLSNLILWIYLSLPLYNHKGFKSYLNGLVVFPTFFNFSLNLAIKSSWSEPQSALGLVLSEFSQNVVHWRREWQATLVFLPWEPHNSMKRQNGCLRRPYK